MTGVAIAAAMTIAPAAAQADTAGLVAAYGFEEPGGTSVLDSSAGGFSGTISGATRSTAGRFGGALSFDGVNDVVTIPDAHAFDVGAMTLGAWVNPSQSSGQWRTVVIKEQPANLAYALYSAEESSRPSVHFFSTAGSEEDARGPGALPLNTWTHLAASYDGATLRLYVNGTQVAARATTRTIVTSSGALRIGGNAVWGEYFKGLIDEVRVYNRPLTAAEIQADMASAIVNPDSTAPTSPVATASVTGSDDVALSWTPATDDVGVTLYRIHRSSSAGFTPGDANLIAQRATPGYTDRDRPVGTHHYRVVAVDAAGNRSAPSDEVSATVEPDTTPPTGGLPGVCGAGGPLSEDVLISLSPNDDRGTLASVELLLDGTRVDLLHGSPWAFRLLTRSFANGAHTLSTVVRDAAGNEATFSCEITIENLPYTVNFTSPGDGATVEGTVSLAVAPRKGDGSPGAVGVQFKVDGANLGARDQQAPYELAWDSRTVAEGPHTISAVLYDVYSQPVATESVNVVVEHPEGPPPDTIAPTAPAGLAATVSGDDVSLGWTASSDNVGVRRYGVHRSTTAGFTPAAGNRLGYADGTTYSDLNRPAGTYHYKVVAEDEAGNLSAPSNAASATIAAAPPTGLVAAYGFEEATGGTVTDASGNGRVGTIEGALRDAGGRFGGALSFDGIDDRVTIPHAASLNLTRMTLEAWVRPSLSSGSWRTVLIKEQPGNLAYALYSAEDNNRPSAHYFSAFNTEEDARGPSALPLNQWTHLAATLDGTALRLYVDGVQVASRTTARPVVSSSSPLRIGGNAVWGEYFKGLIDEVRIYNRALTEAELQADRDRPVGP